MEKNQATDRAAPRHGLVAWSVAALVAGMVGMSFAAVPLYQMFCRATGYAGTTQVASQGSETRGERALTVRFDTNIASDLPWTLTPENPSVTVTTGETKTVFFRVHNRSDKATAGVAGYNVSPDQSGAYFTKISCFCFNEQRLAPGETAEWPVVFYLDQALEKDDTMKQVESVTLSYTMYASKDRPGSQPDRKF
jgi:cytochrome c oxidase assembly protein subunit 11